MTVCPGVTGTSKYAVGAAPALEGPAATEAGSEAATTGAVDWTGLDEMAAADDAASVAAAADWGGDVVEGMAGGKGAFVPVRADDEEGPGSVRARFAGPASDKSSWASVRVLAPRVVSEAAAEVAAIAAAGPVGAVGGTEAFWGGSK